MKVFFGGGLNEQQTPHISEAAKGSYNFDLFKDSYKLTPRAPFDLKGTAPNAGEIRGFIQLVKRDNSETTLVQAAGNVYRWDGASAYTLLATVNSASQLRDSYWSLDDFAVVTDLAKLTAVSKYDGATFGALTTGLGSTLYAKYSVVRNGRVWLFNVKTGSTDTPHLMVASVFETPTSYDTTKRAKDSSFTTGSEAFYMTTPDLRPINGVAFFNDQLIISTFEGRLYRLTGTDSRDFAWVEYYAGSQAVGNESLCNIGNDVIYMRKGGNIDTLQDTQRSGDVAADDVSTWIPNSISGLTDSITIYDQTNQKVLFFVTNKILVLFKDLYYGGALISDSGERAKVSPWSVYKTLDPGNFNTSAAKYMRMPGTSTYTVYFGGTAGQIYDLNGTGTSGDGGAYAIQVQRKTRLLDSRDGINFMRHVTRGTVRYRRIEEVSFSINLDWADDYNDSTSSVTLKGVPSSDTGIYFGGSGYYGGAFYYSMGFTFSDKISHQNWSAVGRGPGCFATFSTESTKDYQVDHVEII